MIQYNDQQNGNLLGIEIYIGAQFSSIVIDIPFGKQNMKMQKLLNPLFGEIRNEYVWGGVWVCVWMCVWKGVTRDHLLLSECFITQY